MKRVGWQPACNQSLAQELRIVLHLSMRRREKLYLKGTEDQKLISGNWEKLKQAHTVMGLIRNGKSHYTVALEMGIPTHKVRSIFKHCMEEFCEDIQSSVASVRDEIHMQLQALIETYMPIAQQVFVDEQRMNSRGEAFTVSDWKHSVAAGELLTKLLAERAKLMGCAKVEAPVTNNYNHAFFSAAGSSSAEIINSLVSSQPSELPETSSDPVVEISFDK